MLFCSFWHVEFYWVLVVYCSGLLLLVILDVVFISWKLLGCRLCLILLFVVEIGCFGIFGFSVNRTVFSLVKAVIFIAFFEPRVYRNNLSTCRSLVGVRSVYTLSSPHPTCGTILRMLLLLTSNIGKKRTTLSIRKWKTQLIGSFWCSITLSFTILCPISKWYFFRCKL